MFSLFLCRQETILALAPSILQRHEIMENQLPLFLLLLTAILLSSSCRDNVENPDENVNRNCDDTLPEIIEGDNAFSFALLQELVAATPADQNIFVSPLSGSLALGMTYNGATGASKEEMQTALQWEGLSDETINEGHACLIEYLEDLDEKVILEIANSIWYDHNYPFLESFLDKNALHYDGEILASNFADPELVNEINDWCAEKTNDKILDILDMVPADAVMYLINAIYFKGDWKFQFDSENTVDATFTPSNGENYTTPMMKIQENFLYYKGENFEVLDLPYGNEKYSMTLFLPQWNELEAFEQNFKHENYNEWIASMEETEVLLTLPKFKVEYKTLLNDPLQNMGMEKVFYDGAAEFGNMTQDGNDVYINRVIHQTFLEVNEEGSEAAAVTIVEIFTESFDPNAPPNFTVNRPFYFCIREREKNTILFMGKMEQPEL